ncbi:MAG: hypothetical protein IIB59_02590 [Planctomycetes bacterium]|nr:hypothetical protein [Planctomycetota bacterium]
MTQINPPVFTRLGIIAGSGQFPFMVADGAKRAGCHVTVIGLRGFADPALAAQHDSRILHRVNPSPRSRSPCTSLRPSRWMSVYTALMLVSPRRSRSFVSSSARSMITRTRSILTDETTASAAA